MSHSHIALRLGILTVALGSAACRSDTTPPIAKDTTPATVTRSITDTLHMLVAESVGELTVIVSNAEGQPLDSSIVTFAITGGGSLTTSSTLTDSLGRASTVWTLGMRTGVQTMTATVGTLTPAVFVVVAMPLSGQYVTKIAGENQSATIGTLVLKNPTVRVTDIYGNPVPNWVVYFYPRNGGLANNNGMEAARPTDSAGIASVTWRLGPNVGPDTLMVQPAGSKTRVPFVAIGLAPP